MGWNAPFDEHRRATKELVCRWCGKALAGRATSWCGDECIRACRLENDWGYMRAHVGKRDKFICQICGVDTKKLSRIFYYAYRYSTREANWLDDVIAEWIGATGNRIELWECDHITPRVEGGKDHIDNLRVLCLKCHRGETAKLARRRAKKKAALPDMFSAEPIGDSAPTP